MGWYLKDGKLLIPDGKIATHADCCCGTTTNCDGCCNSMTQGDLIMTLPALDWYSYSGHCSACPDIEGSPYILTRTSSGDDSCLRTWEYTQEDYCTYNSYIYDLSAFVTFTCSDSIITWQAGIGLAMRDYPNTHVTANAWLDTREVVDNNCWTGAVDGVISIDWLESYVGGGLSPCLETHWTAYDPLMVEAA